MRNFRQSITSTLDSTSHVQEYHYYKQSINIFIKYSIHLLHILIQIHWEENIYIHQPWMTLLTVLLPIQIFYQHHNDPIKIKMGVAWFCNFTITPAKWVVLLPPLCVSWNCVYNIIYMEYKMYCVARDPLKKCMYIHWSTTNRVLEKRNRFLWRHNIIIFCCLGHICTSGELFYSPKRFLCLRL